MIRDAAGWVVNNGVSQREERLKGPKICVMGPIADQECIGEKSTTQLAEEEVAHGPMMGN